jgi:hypothetical protein
MPERVLRFPLLPLGGDEGLPTLDDLFRAYVPRTGVEVLDQKVSRLQCLACGRRKKADVTKPKNAWLNCPNGCGASTRGSATPPVP